MRSTTADLGFAAPRGPEEVALDAWLEDSSHYVSLREPKLRRKQEAVLRLPADDIAPLMRDS